MQVLRMSQYARFGNLLFSVVGFVLYPVDTGCALILVHWRVVLRRDRNSILTLQSMLPVDTEVDPPDSPKSTLWRDGLRAVREQEEEP